MFMNPVSQQVHVALSPHLFGLSLWVTSDTCQHHGASSESVCRLQWTTSLHLAIQTPVTRLTSGLRGRLLLLRYPVAARSFAPLGPHDVSSHAVTTLEKVVIQSSLCRCLPTHVLADVHQLGQGESAALWADMDPHIALSAALPARII